MANPEHLTILKQGVETWNNWRENNPQIKPNLRGAKLIDQNLEGANFSGADIRSTDFTDAKLQRANFAKAKAGLRKYLVITLIFNSLLISALSATCYLITRATITLMFSQNADLNNIQSVISSSILLIINLIFVIATVREGLFAGLGSVAVAGVGSPVFTLARKSRSTTKLISIGLMTVAAIIAGAAGLALPLLGAVTVALLGAVAVAATLAVAVAVLVAAGTAPVAAASIEVVAFVLVAAAAIEVTRAETVALAEMVVKVGIMAVGAYIGWRAMKEDGDARDAWVRDLAVALAATRGTSFRRANLTDANFTNTILKNSDFGEANLTRTRWEKAQKLHLARLGDSYLKTLKVKEWLINKSGDKKFDLLNLQDANLSGASFINANLSEVNLQNANLSRAKLVRTQLDRTNFTGATLTGAYIEDWGITRNTVFDQVECHHVYLKLPTKSEPEPNRMPPLQQGNFGENDFYIFITSILDTLDLYHRQNINAGLAITILKGLTQDYPVQFEIVGLENRGSDQFLIKLKVFGKVSHFQLKQEYYAKYEQALPLYDPKKLIPNTDNIIAKIIEKVNNNPGTQIKSLYNEGIIITGGKVDIMEGNSYSITGDNNQAVQGDNNQVTQQSRVDTNTGEEITQAKVIELLAELSQKILSSELSEETKTKTLNRLSTVADDAKEPQPNKELVTGNLKKVTEILAEASKSTEEAKKLWNNVQPILKIIAKWLGVGIKVLTGM